MARKEFYRFPSTISQGGKWNPKTREGLYQNAR